MIKKSAYFILVLGLAIWLLQSQIYRLKKTKKVPGFIKERLEFLGKQALLHNDIPISAVVLYKDSIIGEGYNMICKDSDLSRHAEIVALNKVFKEHGNTFRDLDRSALSLYSTYEPCEMCKGAILLYGIKNIYFEETKPFLKQVKSSIRSMLYNTEINRFDAPNLQESLFEMHPERPSKVKTSK